MASMAPVALILLMLAGLLWWMRRMTGRTTISGRHIQVVETVTLGPGRFLHLVRLAGRAMLIASSAQHCELLCELDTLPPEPEPESNSWMGALRARLGRS